MVVVVTAVVTVEGDVVATTTSPVVLVEVAAVVTDFVTVEALVEEDNDPDSAAMLSAILDGKQLIPSPQVPGGQGPHWKCQSWAVQLTPG